MLRLNVTEEEYLELQQAGHQGWLDGVDYIPLTVEAMFGPVVYSIIRACNDDPIELKVIKRIETFERIEAI